MQGLRISFSGESASDIWKNKCSGSQYASCSLFTGNDSSGIGVENGKNILVLYADSAYCGFNSVRGRKSQS